MTDIINYVYVIKFKINYVHTIVQIKLYVF